MQQEFFISQQEAKQLLTRTAKLEQMLFLIMEKLDKLHRKQQKEERQQSDWFTIDEAAAEIKKSRSTVKNVLKFEPKIQRQKEGKKMNLVHRTEFLKAYSMYKVQEFSVKSPKLSTGQNTVQRAS